MTKYRNHLPQLDGALFLADGGLETTLVFHEGIDLPHFAAFDLLKDEEGPRTLRRYFEPYIEIAKRRRVGIVLESPTWRASADWAEKMGYDATALADANRRSIGLLLALRKAHETKTTPIVISGNLGPRGDGYRADAQMSAGEARAYHAAQIDTFAGTDADMVCAVTLNYVEEAVGIVQSARDARMPVAVAFTVETDGRLPSGTALKDAIRKTDEATDGYPVYYMINCAHPTHFQHVLHDSGAWRERIRGVRANASTKSHAELDESTELDAGSPEELGNQYRELRDLLPRLTVLGGCCGTDHRHVEAISIACAPAEAAA